MTTEHTAVTEAPETEPFFCPPDHSHGEGSTCRSLHHCKCEDCRRFGREYEFWRAAQKRRGRPLLVDVTGTVRRIRALQRLGYSQKAIALECGRAEPWVGGIQRNAKVTPATAARVKATYDRLCMTPPTPRTSNERAGVVRTRRYAERMDWPPPLAYDDEHIDDPRYEPDGWIRGGA